MSRALDPQLCQESQISSLGIDAYLVNLRDFGSFLSNTGGAHAGSVWGRVVANSAMLGDNYGFGPLTLLLVLLVLGAVVHVCTDERARTFSWLLLGCGATYLAYFVFLSTVDFRTLGLGLCGVGERVE